MKKLGTIVLTGYFFLVVPLAVIYLVWAANPVHPKRPAATEYLGTDSPASGPAKRLTASWYGRERINKPMANGELFNPNRYTCASWDYPLGTWLRVSVGNKGVYCKVTDRGPAKRLLRSRRLDLSQDAFDQLGDLHKGLLSVTVKESK